MFKRLPSLFRGISTLTDVVRHSPQQIAVLHGSHSGNSHRYAKHLAFELKWRLNIDVQPRNIANLDCSDIDRLTEMDKLLIFVSTYGQGEPNEATLPLWAGLKFADRLACSYAVFSRGSSLYDSTFAQAGKDLDEYLHGVGARRIAPVGIQDKVSPEEHDQYFLWKESVIAALKRDYGYTERPFIYEPSNSSQEIDSASDAAIEPILPGHANAAKLCDVHVQILNQTDRQYVTAAVDVGPYKPGDYVVLWPENRQTEIEKFLKAMFGDSERKNSLVQFKGKTTSYELLAKHFIDIQGQPERETLWKLAQVATPATKSRIEPYLKGEPMPSLADVLSLADEPWAQSLPLPAAIFDLLPHIEPRRYSISTSPLTSKYAELTAVVEHDPETGFYGAATGQLREISGSSKSQVFAAHEPLPSFNLPSPEAPLALFGVGTGVAPFRGFVKERYELQKRDPKQKSGKIVLFSCSRSPEDLIYREEFEAFARDPDFDFTLLPAYSRLPSEYRPKYLAELLDAHEKLIFDILDKTGHLFVCGDIRKVRRTLKPAIGAILAKFRGKSNAKPEFKAMQKDGRVHLELW